MTAPAAAPASVERPWPAPCPVCAAGRDRLLLRLDFLAGFPDDLALVRCLGCGTERIDPRPAPSRMDRHYDRAYYEEGYLPFADRRRADFRRRLHELERFGPVAAARRSGRPPRGLDVGAGVGLFVAEARDAGWEMAGVEPSAAAREVAAGAFAVDLAASWPPPGEGHDAVFLWDVLGHADDPRALLAAARSRLAPGGGLVVKIPNFQSGWHRIRTWMSARRRVNLLHAPTVMWRFSRGGLVRLLAETGFRLESAASVREPDLLALTPRWRLVRLATDLADALMDNRQEIIFRARAR